MAGDIRPYGADPSLIPEFDVLLAGFPCQPFSLAGVSKKNSLGRAHGFADEKQGNLFFEIESIIRHHRRQAPQRLPARERQAPRTARQGPHVRGDPSYARG